MADSEWIKPGVEVVAFIDNSRKGCPTFKRTTVLKVAAKSFTLDGISERINLATLKSKDIGGAWSWWHWEVTEPTSPKAQELAVRVLLYRLHSAAVSAVGHWNTGDGRDNPELLDAALDALQAYRRALSLREGEQ